ncbi:MAG: radical SAM protein [Deltaproteobacteria bacterium]|nr:radical SAM protein [Deltaproteobacteria bacterium]
MSHPAILAARTEPFGAWVMLTDHTLVAVDQARARTLGLDGGPQWLSHHTAPTFALEAHVATTSRCPARCTSCYQDASPEGTHVPREALSHTLRALAQAQVFTVAFGGGEPLTRDDLASLALEARALGLVPVLTTSGLGFRDEHIEILRAFAQVNVSHDGVSGGYEQVRGFDAAATAERTITELVRHGIPVGVNIVLTQRTFASLEATVRRVCALGVREVQLLRYKPQGRAASLDYFTQRLTPAQITALWPTLQRLSTDPTLPVSVRIDCAMTPFLVEHVHDPAPLAQWGIFGCEAGRHLTAVDRQGQLAPCSFVPNEPDESSTSAPFATQWTQRKSLTQFRNLAESPPEPCAQCALHTVCRGGCKVVSGFIDHALGPDPECPRVRAHRGSP